MCCSEKLIIHFLKKTAMPNFKTCVNGHNYDADLYPVCPFCPANTSAADYEKTLTDFKKTKLFDGANNQQFNKTQISDETADFKTTPVGAGRPAEHPFKRTHIVTHEAAGASRPAQGAEKRKLVGWLVTFSQDEYGQDFKLYAGKNRIGNAPGVDIVINDPSVSADHATILFRENDFLIRDNFSTNGTKINGALVDEGKFREGDELKLGNTTFKFKTVF